MKAETSQEAIAVVQSGGNKGSKYRQNRLGYVHRRQTLQ